MRCLVVATLALLSGCGGETPAKPPPDKPKPDAGVTGCAAGERTLEDGACQPAGVRPEACGEGFQPNGASGCDPILPAAPCAAGQMAIPGETACRDVAPCAAGKWGDIPVDATTQYVDAAYAGTDSDGTEAHPWKTISEAVVAADWDAVVAIAEGTYTESVFVDHTVHLWGKCPALVEIVGPASGLAAVDIENGGISTEVHTLAVTGATIGLAASGAKDVLVDRVWFHDMTRAAIAMEPTLGAVSMTVEDSLIERVHDVGIYTDQAKLTLSRSVIRDTKPGPQGQGRGVHVQTHANKPPGEATITSCVIERTREIGIYVAASHVVIEGTVVQDTQSNSLKQGGRGIDVLDIDTSGQRADVSVKTSVLQRNREMQLSGEASDITVESTTVRDGISMESDKSMGRGIAIQDRSSHATFTLRESVIERSKDGGVVVLGSDATLESVLIRDVAPQESNQDFGYGLTIQFGTTPADRSNVTMRWSVIDGTHQFGVAVLTSDATLEASAVRNTLSAADGTMGDGIAVVNVFENPTDTSNAVLAGLRVENNVRAGISNFGSIVSLSATVLECNPIQLDAEEFEDPAAGFTNSGGVVCGCGGVTETCVALSAALTPPKAVP